MKNFFGLLVRLAGCLLIACSASESWAAEVKSKAESEREYLHFGNMGGLMPNLDPRDLKDPDSEGSRHIVKYCGQCHNVPGPSMHTREEWSLVFWRMIWRMQMMRAQFKNFLVPTYAESHVMFSYLSANAIQAISASDVPTQNEGAKDYLKICMQCHRLPAPTQHEPKDWHKVVNRMRSHMKNMGKVVPSPDEADRIVKFLKSQAVTP
ncbi:MAG: hypothetical protein H7839_02350 [Magnetococcus sp. YQC-5]